MDQDRLQKRLAAEARRTSIRAVAALLSVPRATLSNYIAGIATFRTAAVVEQRAQALQALGWPPAAGDEPTPPEAA